MNWRVVLFILAASCVAIASQGPEQKTVWQGVYTDAQAERGAKAYMANCAPCHGEELEGVANLKGNDFMERWREFDVRAMYDWVSKSMPRQRRGSPNRPGSLDQSTYVDIIAHVFKGNSFPSGQKELSVELMKSIRIEKQDGPHPPPDGALIQTVGCLTKRGTGWAVTKASDPTRTASPDKSTDEEMKDANAKALGFQQYALTNLGYAGFDPEAHVNERIQTKGTLIRQPGNNRISVTSLESIGSCQ